MGMDSIIRFFYRAEGWIYFFAFIVFGISLINLIKALLEKRSAIFGLEQEVAKKKIRNALTGIILVVIFSIAEFVFVIFTNVKFPGLNQIATPTVAILQTPTISFGAVEGAPGIDQTGTPNPIVAGVSGCISGQIEWASPRPGEEVRGSVELKGTVNVVNLGFYKYEYQLLGMQNWITISGGNTGTINSPLGGNWNTSELTPGNYLLRLLVLDNNNNPFPECVINVIVVAP
jgi:hypothetical protein